MQIALDNEKFVPRHASLVFFLRRLLKSNPTSHHIVVESYKYIVVTLWKNALFLFKKIAKSESRHRN